MSDDLVMMYLADEDVYRVKHLPTGAWVDVPRYALMDARFRLLREPARRRRLMEIVRDLLLAYGRNKLEATT